jgi:phage anti-repressor protein
VNARELHGFLGSNKQFSNWITDRIKKYGFTENVDFVTANLKSLANQTLKEYHISIDMAKELSMVERNDQGKQARQYFIECEKKLKAVAPSALPSFPEALRLLAAIQAVEAPAKVAVFSPPVSLNGIKTMSSVEIVEVINAMRKPGSAVLAHDNFLKKIKAHPGITGVNFYGSYSDPLGREQNCYYLPKREAELMVMSESLEVQTKVAPEGATA